MVEWHHQLNGHEFEQAPGDNEGQGSLACCSPWGCKESDTTEWLNDKKIKTRLQEQQQQKSDGIDYSETRLSRQRGLSH